MASELSEHPRQGPQCPAEATAVRSGWNQDSRQRRPQPWVRRQPPPLTDSRRACQPRSRSPEARRPVRRLRTNSLQPGASGLSGRAVTAAAGRSPLRCLSDIPQNERQGHVQFQKERKACRHGTGRVPLRVRDKHANFHVKLPKTTGQRGYAWYRHTGPEQNTAGCSDSTFAERCMLRGGGSALTACWAFVLSCNTFYA